MVGSWGKPAGVASATAKTDSATACACRRQLAAAGWAPRMELIDQAARACRGHGCLDLDPLMRKARADQAARACTPNASHGVRAPPRWNHHGGGWIRASFGVRLLRACGLELDVVAAVG